MVLLIELRKLEKSFGKDKWAVRFGSIEGSTEVHNLSRSELVKEINDMIREESRRDE